MHYSREAVRISDWSFTIHAPLSVSTHYDYNISRVCGVVLSPDELNALGHRFSTWAFEAFKGAVKDPYDEAHFWLNGYVNKQNCRIWSEANPQVCVETPLHPEKLTVWCALWAGGILLQKR
ncbi:uncharacterized protein TNCV_4661321 [Trichonephila clavipes]|uniref:Uncharacterized protein n=1 Tax=Trichonephila clavipes TaxID=2585209 RepID=A0A8X6SCV7_TRICX|nr:uncharacterized protein TNCV_4661321 [Trichonephila clavipes]